MVQDIQLAAWVDRADQLSAYSPRSAIRDLIAAAPAGSSKRREAADLLSWWRGLEEGRAAMSVEQSQDDALAGLRCIPSRQRQRRAGFQAGVMVQCDLDEAEMDVMNDAMAAAKAVA